MVGPSVLALSGYGGTEGVEHSRKQSNPQHSKYRTIKKETTDLRVWLQPGITFFL